MELRPGLRLESTTSETEIVVVKAPAGADLDVRCGGQPMAEQGSGTSNGDAADGETLMGKRYSSEELGLEVLCTKPGAGALSVGDTPLEIKGAKPLPSSD
jgi:hypothetical protein